MITTLQSMPPPVPRWLPAAVRRWGMRTIHTDHDHIDHRVHLTGWVTWWWARMPEMRVVAARILPRHAGSAEARARALWTWVRRNIRYANEAGELIELPGWTLRHRLADCDGHTLLMLALAGSVGIDGTAMVGWRTRCDGQRAPWHMWPMLLVRGKWRHADTTLTRAFGQDPRPVLARLQAAQRCPV